MSTTRARFRAVIVAVAPAVLLVGFAYHPYVANATDTAAVAAAAATDTTRWGLSHVTVGVGYSLAVLAFAAVRSYLRAAGEERWSSIGLPLAAFGSALFVILPGMEFAPLTAAETGGDPAAAQDEVVPWFVPIFVVAAITFALGAVSFAIGITRSGMLSARLNWLVAGGLVVMATARFVPLGAAQIVVGVAAVVALWPLAYAMWRSAEGTAQARE